MPELFLSHAATDTELAEFLERELRAALPGVDIYRTTRVGQIGAGKEWFLEIGRHLRSAEHFLVLLTSSSIRRPWISFETGAAWIRDKVLVPVVAAGLAKHDVPEPLKFLQLLSLEDEVEAAQVFVDLGGELRDPHAFVGHVLQLGRIVKRNAVEDEGFSSIQYKGITYAWDGPLESLTEGQPAGVPDGLQDALQGAGLRCTFDEGDLNRSFSKDYTILWKIDDRMRRHKLVDRYKRTFMVRVESTATGA